MTTGVGNSNWQFLAVNGQPQPGGTVQSGGGGYYSVLDMKRAAADPAKTPYAEYPDGYLGNVNSRREDRLLTHVQSRLTQRSYQRGVHKGERIDPQDYYWNDAVDPQAGLRAQARGEKWTAQGTQAEQINHMGKNHLLSPEQMADVANGLGIKAPNTQIDPIHSARMSRLLPSWR